jgi:WD40 repeat protein/serine/threonine protein kinase
MSERAIFIAALEKDDPAERCAFLDQACADDRPLRQRIERLLKSHEPADSFLEHRPPGLGVTVDEAPMAEQPGTLIGPYKLMEQIGEGGMGLVFVAEQQHPVRRKVALKIIKPGMDSARVIARFEAERQALALMDHQHIAKVFDAGTTESGRPFFVMELVHGVPITDYCDANKLTPRQRLELFVPVCHAIQHAHQKGIIHRDIKPSNILVTMYDDKPVAKVIDFGVAKAVEQRLTEKTVYTQFGTLIGTFEYMSPEQAEMNAFGVDTRSDIYSLGVLLYEMLTGTTPLERSRLREAAYGEIVRLIKEEEPPPPSMRLSNSGAALAGVSQQRGSAPDKLARLVRGELDWIVMRCLEKDRTRRYETANSLVRDVERYLKDEPVEACPPTTAYRLRKFARKHKSMLISATSFAFLLVMSVAASTWQAVRATEAETVALEKEREAEHHAVKAEHNEQEAKKERDEVTALNERLKATLKELRATQEQLRRTLYAAHMNLAQQAWHARGIGRTEELLNQHRPKPGETDLRGFEWHYLYRVSQPVLVMRQRFSAHCVAYSPDGKRLASGSFGEVKVWDAQTGKALATITVNEESVNNVAFSPDGKRLAAGLKKGNVKVWDVQTRKELLTLKGHTGGAHSVAYSPDGKRLASAAPDNTVKVWDAQTGVELLTLTGHIGGVNSVAFSPDGTRLASSAGSLGQAGETKVWDAQTGKELFTLSGSRLSVAFSPDGERLASNSMYGVTVWNAKTGKELLTVKNIKGGVRSVAFSADGKRLATGSSEMQPVDGPQNQGGDVKMWDAQTGQELVTLPAHTGFGVNVAFSPDGKHLASIGDRTVKVWDVQAHLNPLILKAPEGKSSVCSVAFSSDGKRLASANMPGLGFGPKGNDQVKVWDTQTGKELISHKVSSRKVVFSPDGKQLACALSDGTVKVWDAHTGKELLSQKGGRGSVVAFSSDGKRLVTGCRAGAGEDVKVWDAQTGQDLATFKAYPGGPVKSVAFSPDDRLLVSTGMVFEGKGPESMLKVWDVQSGKELFKHKLPTVVSYSAVFSPDGKRLASHTYDAVKVWHAQTGEELLTLKGHTGGVNRVVFSPDGKRLVSAASDKTIRMWDALTGQELLTLEGHSGNVNGVAFSPDGHRLAAGSSAGTVKIWDATPLPEKPME